MNALFTGIYSKFSNDTDLSGAVTGLYLSEAPQNVAFPYAVYFMVSDTHDWQFVEEFEEVLIQFNIFSESASIAEAGTILGYLKTLYDDCALTVSGYDHIYMQREFIYSYRDADAMTWAYSVQYRVYLKKQ